MKSMIEVTGPRWSILRLVVVLVAMSLLPMGSTSVLAEDDPFPRTIKVTGQGKASAVPDMATIQTGVTSQAKSALEAMEANNAAADAILNQLKKLNVDEKDVQTSRFSVQPVYDRGPRGERRNEVTAYRVSNQVSVKVRKIDDLGKLLDAVVRAGSNQLSGVAFGLQDDSDVMNEARKKAIEDARRKAELYAATAGVGVGKVISISEQPALRPQPMMMGRGMEMSAASVPIATGEQEYSASIFVEFELTDR